MADFTALAAARREVLRQVGWDLENDGLAASPPLTIVVGEEVHATMLKALKLLGFGNRQIRVVSTDSQGRMQPALIPRCQRRSSFVRNSET